MTAHSPAPWELSGDLIVGAPEPRPNPKVEPHPHAVAKLCWDFDGDRGANGDLPWAVAKANGQLIIAAPAMLSALQFAADRLRTMVDAAEATDLDYECLRTIDAVIGQATGNGSQPVTPPAVLPALPRDLVCPHCGHNEILFIEDISCVRHVEDFVEDVLVIDGLYKTDGFDEGTNPRFQCSECCQEFAMTGDDVEIEFL